MWHYHDDDVDGPDAAVSLKISGLGKASGLQLVHYRIDGDHSNAFAAWKKAGSPIAPDEKLYARIEQAGKLEALSAPAAVSVSQGEASLDFNLPRQGVSLIVLGPSGP